ncbi:diguanylate cyclase [Frankia sp. AgB1.9]|uniref:diguanylate cyclase domain-containing protein n=1 Tax=unclassified Frankia TaxID=2632575 RepID=UPI0019313F1C|nr:MULTISPECIES: diguanylate cyclase [unclassified Frankia]MBL7493066.1 diguanylate cyclase [Frankia sp. AgW1.1]MBL7547703.1 diguanylate cyclase [Frankia sp. AgB1.9]MBL7622655.1 diguanylate cyclase [Frankia sp. AgB1.8]
MWAVELFDVLEMGLTLSGVEDRRIRRANAAACQMAGRDEADLVGMDWRDMVDPAQFDDLFVSMERVVGGGEKSRGQRLVRLVRPDGTVTPALSSGVIVDVDGEQCVLAQFQDVSELISTQVQLQTVLDHVPVAVFLLDQDGRVVARGGSATHDPVAEPGRFDESRIRAAFRDRPDLVALMRRSMGGEYVHEVLEAYGRWYDLHLVPLPGAGGRPSSLAGVASDVTDRERATAELLVRTARQTALADLAQRALESADEQPLWDHCVRTLTEQLGADQVVVRRHLVDDGPADELAGPPGWGAPDRPPTPAGDDERRWPGEEARWADRGAHRTGDHPAGDHPAGERAAEEPESERSVVRIPIGSATEPLATITIRRAARELTSEDVDFARSVGAVLGSAVLRIRVEAATRFWSLHDPLTGLPNRGALLDRLRRSLRRAQRDGHRTGVLFIDLDGFKAVNDTFGHQAGDELLKVIGDRLRRVIRPGDVVSRLGGDEFAMLCEGVDGLDDLRAIGERVMHELAPPVELHRPVSVGGSVGLALSGPDLTDAEQLLDAADVAMYQAKQGGPGRCVAYDERVRATIATRLRDITELRRAFGAGELRPRFRPVADRTRTVFAAEAVACWLHPTRSWLGPEDIEPIAFEAGLSGDLDGWLVDNMIRYLEVLRRPDAPGPPGPAGHGDPGRPRELWLRLSDRGLRDAALRKELIAHAAGSGEPAARGPVPCVLVPDTLRRADRQQSDAIIDELAEAGVAVRLDFAELGPIRAVTVDSLPRGLVGVRLSDKNARAVGHDETAQAILAGLIRILHLLRLDVTVRGVDTPAELAAVRALNCDLFQGSAVGPDLHHRRADSRSACGGSAAV